MFLAYDRDGTVVGNPYNFEGNHPQNILKPSDMVIIPEVAETINKWGGAIASNQQGVKSGYKSLQVVIDESLWLLEQLPGLKLVIFCPDEGATAWAVSRSKTWEISNDFPALAGLWRKSGPGMLIALRHLFPDIGGYVGDLCGLPWYGDGRDTDSKAARAAKMPFIDVRQFVVR